MGESPIGQSEYSAGVASATESRRPAGDARRVDGPDWAGASLVDAAIAASSGRRPEASARLEQFLQASSPSEALRQWLAWSVPVTTPLTKTVVAEILGRDIARLDAMLTAQVNAILHQERFQKLEASWRGLKYLVEQAADVENIKVRVLNLPWKELARDVERASEFDQSQLFRKIYSEEFDMPGGEPFGVLIGDYEIRPRAGPGHPIDDIGVLSTVSQVAAAAFAPFIAAAHPSMLELEDYQALERPLDLPRTFEQLDYLKWRAFRETEDARFVGLTLPHVLMRKPYEDDGSRVDGFVFREQAGAPDGRGYLWGNAAYAFAGVLSRCFDQSHWLAGIRGARRSVDGGGVVPGLPVHCFGTDRLGVAPKCSTEVVITDALEQELSDLGLIPLCHCRDTELSVFYTNCSVQKPKRYDELAATINARISAMLQYMFCVSRFAHYLKIIARDKIGTFMEAGQCERFLNDWLHRYVTSDRDANLDVKAAYPLREAAVQVKEHPGKPGCYLCVAHLWPHFDLDELVGSVKVTTELSPGRPG